MNTPVDPKDAVLGSATVTGSKFDQRPGDTMLKVVKNWSGKEGWSLARGSFVCDYK